MEKKNNSHWDKCLSLIKLLRPKYKFYKQVFDNSFCFCIIENGIQVFYYVNDVYEPYLKRFVDIKADKNTGILNFQPISSKFSLSGNSIFIKFHY